MFLLGATALTLLHLLIIIVQITTTHTLSTSAIASPRSSYIVITPTVAQHDTHASTVGSRFYHNPWWVGVAFQNRGYSSTECIFRQRTLK